MVRRRIKKAQIQKIALCRKPKNGLTVLYKGETDEVEFVTLTKMSEEGLLHALVILPNRVDLDGDDANKQVVRSMAHTFIKNGARFDIGHTEDLTDDQIYLVESTIIQKGDTRFEGFKDAQGNVVDATDGWGIIAQVVDTDLRERIKSGELGGVSFFGPGVVEIISKSEPQEGQMTPEQMKALLDGLAATLSKSVGDAVSAAIKPPAASAELSKAEAVAFEGDIMNPEDIARHQDKVLFASLDLSKAADVQKWQAHVAKRAPAKPADQKTELEKAQADLQAATAKLALLQKSSSQSPADGTGEAPVSEQYVGLSKAESTAAQKAVALAQLINKQNGRA